VSTSLKVDAFSQAVKVGLSTADALYLKAV
jgi:hypothetical protein